MAAVLFNNVAGVDIGHVPYGNTQAAALGLLTGDVTMTFGGLSGSIPQIKAGKMRALAVTGPNRAAALPDGATASRGRKAQDGERDLKKSAIYFAREAK